MTLNIAIELMKTLEVEIKEVTLEEGELYWTAESRVKLSEVQDIRRTAEEDDQEFSSRIIIEGYKEVEYNGELYTVCISEEITAFKTDKDGYIKVEIAFLEALNKREVA